MDKAMPDYHEAMNNRGIAHADRGDYGSAIEDFNSTLRIKPDVTP